MNAIQDDLPPPTSISDEDVQEFQRLVKEHANVDLEADEARARLGDLVRVALIIVGGAKEADAPAPAETSKSEVATELLSGLAELSAALKEIRSHSKDWAWSVKVTHRLLGRALVARIEEAYQRRPGGLPALTSWRDDTLPALLPQAGRLGVALPSWAEGTAGRLHRLTREIGFITVQLWEVLAAQVPDLLRDGVVLVGSLLWEPGVETSVLTEEERSKAAVTAREVLDRLLVLDGPDGGRVR